MRRLVTFDVNLVQHIPAPYRGPLAELDAGQVAVDLRENVHLLYRLHAPHELAYRIEHGVRHDDRRHRRRGCRPRRDASRTKSHEVARQPSGSEHCRQYDCRRQLSASFVSEIFFPVRHDAFTSLTQDSIQASEHECNFCRNECARNDRHALRKDQCEPCRRQSAGLIPVSRTNTLRSARTER